MQKLSICVGHGPGTQGGWGQGVEVKGGQGEGGQGGV